MIGVCTLAYSCTKNTDSDEAKQTTENQLQAKLTLLTNHTWSLKGQGSDNNNNNIVDASENVLSNCSNFSTWIFSSNGTIQESARTCPWNRSATTYKFFLTQSLDNKIYMTWDGDTYLLTFTNNDKTVHIKEVQLGTSPSDVWMLERP